MVEQDKELFEKWRKWNSQGMKVYPDSKETEWMNFRRISDLSVLNDGPINQQVFNELWEYFEFIEWRNHRLALLNILQDHNPFEGDYYNFEISNNSLQTKILGNPELKEKYWDYYRNQFHDFD